MGRMGRKGLAAIILGVVLISPGTSGGQGQPLTGGRFTNSPRQADKSYSQEQQEKQQPRLRNQKKPPRTSGKERLSGKGSATQTPPPTTPPKGAPVGSPGQ